MKNIVERYLTGGERLVELYAENKKHYKSYSQFTGKVNKFIDGNHYQKPISFFERNAWQYKNDGVWTPATYEELSLPEKEIYNARARKNFVP